MHVLSPAHTHILTGEAAKFIRNQEIQVLVDLSGHSRTSGMSILALQPAPIQVSFLGWPGTTGAPFIQYFVGDRTSIPEDLDVEFTEKLILLPHAPVVGAHRRIASSSSSPSPSVEVFTRENVGLPNDGFLFCNFGSLSKIDSAAVDYWNRILEGTPESVLWLFGGEKEAMANVKNEFKKRGLEHSGPKVCKKREKVMQSRKERRWRTRGDRRRERTAAEKKRGRDDKKGRERREGRATMEGRRGRKYEKGEERRSEGVQL
jgi:predicted O-linked N-acetylglucosamine transferase (SPINDLY family)